MIKKRKSTNIFTPKDMTKVTSSTISSDAVQWTEDENWSDLHTGRALMQVTGISFSKDNKNRWTLSYKVRNFTRRHRWVHKLDAIDADGEVLCTIVMPPVLCCPADRIHNVSIRKRFRALAVHESQIDQFIRRGAGEYRA
ncbi:hypothetical protein NHH03_11590 [Stieleria sp. TO1_6]|uniref:hypothetical protein n=1 Tax=Stieleria tagensis TaxID=2956795 RepID=UPI00209B0753|nr:hypothetical protein [Stieleria tagensis]MCO8122380.1 hypothetical protein [Stieleria tagensis]